MAEMTKVTPPKLTAMFKVGYAFQGTRSPDLRTNSLLIRAVDQNDAREQARKILAERYDWYKINTVTIIEGDHPQRTL